MAMNLVRTDRNGTEYYEGTDTCPKCGGRGVISSFYFIDAGRCFTCGGSGEVPKKFKKYTPEYEAKLNERRAKKAEEARLALIEKADEINAEFLVQNGFNKDGITYVVLGNTYEIKETLKAAGASFDRIFGWHFTSEPEGMIFVDINVDDVCQKNDLNQWEFIEGAKAIVDRKKQMFTGECGSEYRGCVGENISWDVFYNSSHGINGRFGWTYCHLFLDEDGNEIVWWTTKSLELNRGDEVYLYGVIKDHKEYNGHKQTIVTRCKVIENETY